MFDVLQASSRTSDYDVAVLQGRMNDMEGMCRKCADKMDIHIGEALHTHTRRFVMKVACRKRKHKLTKGLSFCSVWSQGSMAKQRPQCQLCHQWQSSAEHSVIGKLVSLQKTDQVS